MFGNLKNRVNLGKFKKTVENAKKNPAATKKTTIIEGFWRLNAKEGPQFETKLKTENTHN